MIRVVRVRPFFVRSLLSVHVRVCDDDGDHTLNRHKKFEPSALPLRDTRLVPGVWTEGLKDQ